MWENLLAFNIPPLNLAIRAFVVYVAVLMLLRISGKRQMGQLGPTEFVAILLISNAVQNSMNGGDNSLSGGLLLAAVLVGMSWLISYLTYKSRYFSRVFEGSPTLLVHKGKVIHKNLAHERMTLAELKVLLRKQGLHSLSEIETAILEADGTFNAVRAEKDLLSGVNLT